MSGAPRMIDHILQALPSPAAVIVGEPTNNHVVSAHKGCLDFLTHITGRAVHSCLNHRGINAISVAARLVIWLDGRQADASANAAASALFDPPFTTFHCGIAPETDVRLEITVDIPAFQYVPGSPAEALMQPLTGDHLVQVKASVTEGGQYQRAGIPTMICGPGTIEQAHLPDEHLEQKQLEDSVGILRRLVLDLSAERPSKASRETAA